VTYVTYKTGNRYTARHHQRETPALGSGRQKRYTGPLHTASAGRNLDFGYAFATADGDVGRIQESEVTGAGWYPLAVAERLVGHRIGRAVSAPQDRLTGPP
jgi:hypothetical protein